MIRTKIKRYFKTPLIIAVFILIILFSYLKVFEVFELTTIDWRFKARPIQKINDNIVIIEIANDTIEKIGRWPFDRLYHANLIDALTFAGAKAILFDVIFSEPSASDSYLVDSIKKAGNVYLAYSFKLSKADTTFLTADGYDTMILKDLEDVSKGTGFINITADIDGKNRRIPLFIKYKGKLYPQLSFLLTCDYLGIPVRNTKVSTCQYAVLNSDIKIPVDKTCSTLINFTGPWAKTFAHYSYVDILKSYAQILNNEKPLIDIMKLKGKICFVGLTATGLHDLNPVPLETRYPMVGLHANLFNTITTKNFLTRLDRIANIIILIILLGLTFILVMRLRPIFSLIAMIIIVFTFLMAAFLLFIAYGIWIDIFYPAIVTVFLYLGITFSKFIREIQKRQLIENELLVAKRIQENFLPQGPPIIEGLRISVNLRTAKHVGGDLYDFVVIGKERLGIMIGDVSGKGVPAALFMAKVISEFKFWAKDEINPSKVIGKLNNQIATESKTGLFVTFLYMVFDIRQNLLTLSNAAHLTPILMRYASDQPQLVGKSTGLPVGLLEGQEFEEETLGLSKGDVIVLYTDGVVEARNKQREEFSEKRLMEVIKEFRNLGADGLTRKILLALDNFVGKISQHDDITILVMEIL